MSATFLRKFISGPLALDVEAVPTGYAIAGPGPVLTSTPLITGGTGPTGPAGPTVAGPAGPTGPTGPAGPTILATTFTNGGGGINTVAIAGAETYHIVAAQPATIANAWFVWGRVQSSGVVQVNIGSDATTDIVQFNLRLIDTRGLPTIAVSGPQ